MFGKYLIAVGTALLLSASALGDEIKYNFTETITVPRLGLNSMKFGERCYQRQLTMNKNGFTLGAFHNREGHDTEIAQNESTWWVDYGNEIGPVTVGGGAEQVNLSKSGQRIHDVYGYVVVSASVNVTIRCFRFFGPTDDLTGFYSDAAFSRKFGGSEVVADVSYNDGMAREGSGIGHIGASVSRNFSFNKGELKFIVGHVWDLTDNDSAYDTTGYFKTEFVTKF
jgi:hypothetical protein